MQKFLFWLLVVVLAMLAFTARCWNLRDVFSEGRIYFIEADAYSRMTRVRMIAEGQGPVIRHHDFENWPQGTTPHTTAPLDWSILALRPLVNAGLAVMDPGKSSVLRNETLDLAGALIGPVLGVLTCLAIALGLPKDCTRERWLIAAGIFFFAVSPILVHGTLLGRPDHQALLILLLGFALSVEVRLMRNATKPWAIAAGCAWGLALWTSLYEPLILLALTLVGIAIVRPSAFRERARRWEWGMIAGGVVIGLLVDGWRVEIPNAAMREAFARWSTTIGEMRPLDLKSGILWTWVGWLIFAAPLALVLKWRQGRNCWLFATWLVATFVLTLCQIRWGYFFALVVAVTLPFVLNALPRAWMGWLAFVFGLWPMMRDWDRLLDDLEQDRGVMVRREQKALREIAEIQGARNAGPFVAPWWLSPPLAYWSRQPGVAGSSHQSLPGIVDTARIYLAPNDEAALPILRQRKVAWVLSDAPERVIPTSAAILGVPAPENCLAQKLAQHIAMPPGTPSNPFFQVWHVPAEGEPPTLHP